ncbi:MAG: adenylate/guanylate cyclase domain-containing protein [Myxococcota bacterium]
MQEALRRYVPDAIAQELASGEGLESGEREVSVLFVDIRGYSSYSEGRAVGEVFSTINRYTEAVSRVVRKYGGSVVEFNGDGMMAVFGAPRALEAKEQAALEAALELVSSVGQIEVPGEAQRLSVGVGVATGAAFVGNIRAVDRMIWSAIGSTTNLAARMQALTRPLEAAVVTDPATWSELELPPAGFERRREVSIHGLSETHDLYVLPLSGMEESP